MDCLLIQEALDKIIDHYGIETDTTIEVDGISFSVHKIVLYCGSTYFRDILKLSMDSTNIIQLSADDVSSCSLRRILYFLYSGFIYVHMDSYDEMLKAAEFLGIPILQEGKSADIMALVSKKPVEADLTNKFFCSMCHKYFRSFLDHDRHNRIHLGVKPFKCPYCLYSACTKGNVKAHVFRRHVHQKIIYREGDSKGDGDGKDEGDGDDNGNGDGKSDGDGNGDAKPKARGRKLRSFIPRHYDPNY